ncbi:GL15576 [Drosophila persimilis]|uniref:GL15576 n=1 Tax=Drosophila persimilis TaxID=7234 RepID=B4H6K6_DROPE|nr:GL15576 [Drosophila persimilis]
MGQRPSAKSVRNFVIFLLILQNSRPGTHPASADKQAEQAGRDGLAKLEFSAQSVHRTGVGEEEALYVFNFAKIYETLYGYARLLQAKSNHSSEIQQNEGRTLLWQPQLQSPDRRVSRKPFHVLEQLQQDLGDKLKRTTTVKPFSVLRKLALEQQKQVMQFQRKSNASFHILEALDMDQEVLDRRTTTTKPFHVLQQLSEDLEEAYRHTTTMKPFHIVNALMEESAKKQDHHPEDEAEEEEGFEKRIRRRRKRTRRRRRKKRKKRRKKRKKKKNKGDKGDKKKKRKKKGKRKRKRKKQKPEPTESPGLALFQPGHVIFANPTKQPHYYHHPHHGEYPSYPHPHQSPSMAVSTALLATLTTTKPPTTTHRPFSKIKYLLRHNSLFKKKKKEYLSHVGQVLYPFVKFVAFFTVLNPFTLGVFLFTLVSPVVFGFLGFVALSVLVKPFLNLVFGVKQNVDAFDRKRFLANKRAERLKLGLRPVTIHKHYYQQKPVHSAPPLNLRPVGHWRRQWGHLQPPPRPSLSPPSTLPAPPTRTMKQHFNPLLPDHREALDMDYDYV